MAIIDDKTTRLGLPKPNVQNFLQDDVERLRESLDDVDGVIATLNADKKLEASQVPDNLARLDAKGILLPAQIPVKVVQKDDNGKIPLALIPQAAINSKYDASNESTMLGLQAIVGDICRRTDLNTYFMLVDTPASNLANWRRWHEDAFYDRFATKANPLEGITGPLALKAEGVGDYDAATMKQLRSVANTGDAATMSGVMNNFIGAVEWFNGSRETIPSGYIAADGLLVSRTDPKTSDLWAAVNSGMLVSVTDALWLNSGFATNIYANRGSYSTGDGSTTFRVPDLNGMVANSIGAVFLRGSNTNVNAFGSPGNIYPNRAPNITGSFAGRATDAANGAIFGGAGAITLAKTGSPGGFLMIDPNGSTRTPDIATFDASKSSPAYGRIGPDGATVTGEVAPNAATGIWIIRANGSFQAANSAFNVLNSDATSPALGTAVYGGTLTSIYNIGKKPKIGTGMRAEYTIGQLLYGSSISTTLYNDDGSANGIFKTGFLTGSVKDWASAEGAADSQTMRVLSMDNGGVWGGQFGMVDNGDTNNGFNCTPYVRSLYNGAFTGWTKVITARNSGWSVVDPTKGRTIPNTEFLAPTGMYSARGSEIGTPGGLTTGGFGLIQFTGSSSSYRCQLAAQDGSGGRLFIRSSTVLTGQTKSTWNPQGWTEFAKTTTSDARIKRRIQNVSGRESLANIQKMAPVSFIYINDEKNRIRRGFIAQDLEKIDPNYVHDRMDENEYRNLDTGALLVDALAAIKVLAERVERLEGRA
ncbi:tail fiber domain-containing protein [Salmonella enterica]|nr:tail fiber domain-containing protein [Salmonella enterica]